MNNELITIVTDNNNNIAVSARELYYQLTNESTHYSRWIKTNLIDNPFFVLNVDYCLNNYVSPNGERYNPNNTTDYILNLNTAKHLCLMSRTAKGKEIREYFIQVEDKYKQLALPSYQIEDAITRAEKWIAEEKQRRELQQLAQHQQLLIEESKDKVDYYNAVTVNEDCNLKSIEEVAKILNLKFNNSGKKIGRNKLYDILRQINVLTKNNIPYQTYIDRGYFAVKQTNKIYSNGQIYNVTLVTQKGIQFINKIFNHIK